MLLTHRKLLQSKAIAIENDLRGTLRNFGLKVGMAGTVKFETRIKELVGNSPELAALVEPLLVVRRVLRGRLRHLASPLAGYPKRQVQADMQTASSIVPRGHHPPLGGAQVPSTGFDPLEFSCCCRELSRVQRNSVPSTQMRCMITANRRASATIAFFIPRRLAICIAPKPRPFLQIQHALSRFVEHDPHRLRRRNVIFGAIDLAGLILGARQSKHGTD